MTKEEKSAINSLAKGLKSDLDGVFPSFYEKTKGPVFYLILSYTKDHSAAEDLMQETYLAFLSSLDKISCRLSPYDYLLTSARNKAIDYLRGRRNGLSLDDEGVSEVIGEEEQPLDDSEPLLKAIASLLSPIEFRIYTLRVLSDLPFKEVAKIVRRPLGSVTAIYSGAIKSSRKDWPLMETEDFEKRINAAAKASPYEIKTSADSILKSFKTEQSEKKSTSKRRGLAIGFASAFGAAAVALGLYIPLSQFKTVDPSDPAVSSYEDIDASPLASEKDALAYEAASLLPYLSRGGASPKQKVSVSEFQNAVDVYENIESPIRSSYSWSSANYQFASGSFPGSDGVTYPYELKLGDEGTLLCDLDLNNAGKTVFGSFKGLATTGGVSYSAAGELTEKAAGLSDLTLRLYSSATSYLEMRQVSNNGRFAFSFGAYADGSLSYGFSYRLAKASARKVVMASYYGAATGKEGTFRVYEKSAEEFKIYQSFFASYITLKYDETGRHYSYGAYSLAK